MVGLLPFLHLRDSGDRLNMSHTKKRTFISIGTSAVLGFVFATFLVTNAQAQSPNSATATASTTAPAATLPAKNSVVKSAKPAKKSMAAPSVSKSDVIFEGYSKILMGSNHIGYTIQRFEFDPKKKEYSTVYYLKTQPPANDVIESLKARSTFDLKPINYQYTELASGKVHTVDATFAGGNVVITELVNGKRTVGTPKKVPPGSFLASFLGYLMLQQKEAVKVGNKYSYQAFAEEDGGLYKGEAFIKSQETTKGIPTFKILNTYKGVQFTSYMTPQGEVLATDSAAQGISTELVANIQEATKGMSVNSNQLAQLFGSVPKGQDNAVSRHSSGEPLGGAPAAAPAATKTNTTPGAVALPDADTPESATAPLKTKQDILHGNTPTERTKTSGVPQGEGIEVKAKPAEGQ